MMHSLLVIMQDAGLYEAKSVVNLPVFGLGEASMLLFLYVSSENWHRNN